jgi:hypothetical protein
MQVASLPSSAVRRNGNGAYPAPRSRRAVIRNALQRVVVVENATEAHELRLDALDAMVNALFGAVAEWRSNPPCAADQVTALRVDNLVEIVGCLVKQVRRVDKRSARGRRRLDVVADRIAALTD